MTRYFFNQDNDLFSINTENDIVQLINVDVTAIAKIKKDFYIDNQGNLFRIFTVGNEFGSMKIPSEHKFIDILKFYGHIFLVSDDYHLFIVDEHGCTCPKIIKFSDQVFPDKIKKIRFRQGDVVLIHHKNSVTIFKVKNDVDVLFVIMEINNVTNVSFKNRSFIVRIKNKYYKVWYDSVQNTYVALFMTTFIVAHAILYFLVLSLMSTYMPISEAILTSWAILLIFVANIIIVKLNFGILLLSVLSINKWAILVTILVTKSIISQIIYLMTIPYKSR